MTDDNRRRSSTSRRRFLAAAAITGAGLASLPVLARQPSRVFRPEDFGAKGNGIANDSAAFAALAAAVTADGGGTVQFRRDATYIVGVQHATSAPKAPQSYVAAKLLEFIGCTKPLILRGNGARIRCASGLRYGIFSRATGDPVHHPMPYIGPGGATPYEAMIRAEDCTGSVEISDLELDGNVDRLRIGGQYGDIGWQIPAHGLVLRNNRGPEQVRNLHTHHHAMDGLYIDGFDGPGAGSAARTITNVRSEYNGRQGCSLVGGHGYAFERCQFNHTGRGAVSSAPGAGVDIEAEKKNRHFSFTDCLFSNNVGCGLVADTGDSEDVRFLRCTFIGTTNWSAWPCKPFFRFDACTFVGAMVRAFGDPKPERAAQFFDCSFRDDPALSPTRQVFGGTNPDRPLADLSDARNVLFNRCAFLATHAAQLPWSVGAIYADCRMEQRSEKPGLPRGTFIGTTTITGKVDLYGSRMLGTVIINGRKS